MTNLLLEWLSYFFYFLSFGFFFGEKQNTVLLDIITAHRMHLLIDAVHYDGLCTFSILLHENDFKNIRLSCDNDEFTVATFNLYLLQEKHLFEYNEAYSQFCRAYDEFSNYPSVATGEVFIDSFNLYIKVYEKNYLLCKTVSKDLLRSFDFSKLDMYLKQLKQF